MVPPVPPAGWPSDAPFSTYAYDDMAIIMKKTTVVAIRLRSQSVLSRGNR